MRACNTPQASDRRYFHDVVRRIVPSLLQSAEIGLDEGKRQ
jgi:hypothetical protein